MPHPLTLGTDANEPEADPRIPEAKSWWRRDVQGLRAVAVLGVIVFHAGLPLPGGFTGVDVFFVISGFVIGGLLLRDLERGRGFPAKEFYLRRARRLLPAAALMTLVVLALSAVLLSPLGQAQTAAGMAASAASVFLSNFYFLRFSGGYFDASSEMNPFLHTWSLSVEEQFYLVLPWVLVVGWLLSGRLRRHRGSGLPGVVAVVSIGWLLSFLLCVLLSIPSLAAQLPIFGGLLANLGDVTVRLAFFTPVTRAWEFLTGVALVLIAQRWRIPANRARPLAWLGLGIVFSGYLLIEEDQHFPGFLALVPVMGTALVIFAGSNSHNTTAGLLTSRTAVRIGDISYGWYLWHWPIIVFAGIWFGSGWVLVAAAALSLIPTLVSYRFMEEPIRRRRWLPSNKAMVATTIACIALPFMSGQALVAAQAHSWGRVDLATANHAIRPDFRYQTDDCPYTTTLGPNGDSCLYLTPGADRTVLLLGDSTAGMYSEPLLEAARDLGVNLEIAVHVSCPIALGVDIGTAACARFVEDSLEAIAESEPPYAAVVVANSGDYPRTWGDEFARVTGEGGAAVGQPIAGYATAVARAVKRIAQTTPVLFIQPIPNGVGEIFPGCLAPSTLAPLDRSCARFDRAYLDSTHIPTVEALSNALGGSVSEFDADSLLCDEDGNCSMYRGDLLMYSDEAHLSVPGSLLYAQPIQQALAQLLGAET